MISFPLKNPSHHIDLFSMEQPKFTVAYALSPKMQASFIRPSLVEAAKQKGIRLVAIDLETPLTEQGPFDLILHKIYTADWIQELAEYSSKNPNVVVIDPHDTIHRLLNRSSMLAPVEELNLDEIGVPKQITVHDATALADLESKLLSEGMNLPVVAKPLVVDGSTKSHKMLLAYNSSGLRKLEPPVVVQEFVNHGGVLLKVYVVGDYVKCVRRESLPDVTVKGLERMSSSLAFSQVSSVEGRETEEIPTGLLEDVAKGLRRATGLHLFNFDVIRDSSIENRYLVIDINYFPGFEKVPGYEGVFESFLHDVLSGKKDGDSPIWA